MRVIVADTAPLNYLVVIEAIGILSSTVCICFDPSSRQERTLARTCTGRSEYLDCQSTRLVESGES